MTQILVVEDDPRISSFLAKGLTAEGYAVRVAASVRQAREAMAEISSEPALILLDLGLPGPDGMSLLSELHQRSTRVPVLIVTARNSTTDKVLGLDAGATDYITKPFAFDEILARIRAALRGVGQESSSIVTIEDLKAHFDGSVRQFWSVDQAQIYRVLAQLAQDDLVTIEIIPQSDRPDRKVHHRTHRCARRSVRTAARRAQRHPLRERSTARRAGTDAAPRNPGQRHPPHAGRNRLAGRPAPVDGRPGREEQQ